MKDSDLTLHKISGDHNWKLLYRDGKAIEECIVCHESRESKEPYTTFSGTGGTCITVSGSNTAFSSYPNSNIITWTDGTVETKYVITDL